MRVPQTKVRRLTQDGEAGGEPSERAADLGTTLAFEEGIEELTAMTESGLNTEQLRARLDGPHLRRDVPLAPYTTFQIGGPADLLYDATSAASLASAISAARESGVPWFVLGLGANILVGDKGFRGLVIRNVARAHEMRPNGHLWSESGAVMQDLVLDTVRQGWSGLEHYIGIPSTVGGALWQNLHFLSPAPDRAQKQCSSPTCSSRAKF